MPILSLPRRRRPRAQAAERPPAAPPTVQAAPRAPRFLIVLLGLALAFAVLLGLNQMRDFVAPVFLALNLVLAAAPLQSWLTRRGLPAWMGALAAGLVVYAFLITFFYALGWAIAEMIEELSSQTYQDRYEELYNQALTAMDGLGIEQDRLASQIEGVLAPERILTVLAGLLGNVGGILTLLLTTVIVVFFLMIDSMSARTRLRYVADDHPSVGAALVSFAQGVRRYWVVTTIFGLIVAVLDVIALFWLGVPLALAWGVLAFITNYIPNVGFVIGLVPPAIIALLANGPANAVLVVVVYSLLNFTIQSLIQPKFTGDAVGVTPTVAFLSLIVWAWVLGPVGALLALPATLLTKAVLVDADPRTRWVNAFLAANPAATRAKTTVDSVHQRT